jgi:hypothetical protein
MFDESFWTKASHNKDSLISEVVYIFVELSFERKPSTIFLSFLAI